MRLVPFHIPVKKDKLAIPWLASCSLDSQMTTSSTSTLPTTASFYDFPASIFVISTKPHPLPPQRVSLLLQSHRHRPLITPVVSSTPRTARGRARATFLQCLIVLSSSYCFLSSKVVKISVTKRNSKGAERERVVVFQWRYSEIGRNPKIDTGFQIVFLYWGFSLSRSRWGCGKLFSIGYEGKAFFLIQFCLFVFVVWMLREIEYPFEFFLWKFVIFSGFIFSGAKMIGISR